MGFALYKDQTETEHVSGQERWEEFLVKIKT